MQTFFYLEINIIGFLILLIICLNQRSFLSVTLQQNVFNQIIYLMMMMLVIDSVTWVIDGKIFSYSILINYIISTIYYIINSLIPLVWYIYVMSYFNENNNLFLRKKIKLFTPIMIDIFLILINLKYHFLFYIDNNNYYHRGKLFYIVSLFICSYILNSICHILQKLKAADIRKEKRDCYYMLVFLILPIIGIIIQFMFYGVSVIWICVVVSILLLFMNLQNAQMSRDALTGLNNRHQFDRYLIKLYSDIQNRKKYSLLMIDVDKFKNINDTYGHVLGDKALIYVADILDITCGKTDSFLARYGGDEFIIICKEHMAENIERTINDKITQFNKSKKEKFTLSLSMGVATFDDEAIHSVDELINMADENMYQQKIKKRMKNLHI